MDTQVTTHDITSRIPSDEICAEFSVKERSIRLARENGFFPASWYLGMRRLCDKHGLDCPERLFNFKSPTTTPSSEAAQPGVSLPVNQRGVDKSPRQGRANLTGEGAA